MIRHLKDKYVLIKPESNSEVVYYSRGKGDKEIKRITAEQYAERKAIIIDTVRYAVKDPEPIEGCLKIKATKFLNLIANMYHKNDYSINIVKTIKARNKKDEEIRAFSNRKWRENN